MYLSDRVTGSALVALGALAAYGGSRLPPVPGQQVGPNVFPMVVGLGLCLCGALIAFGIGRGFEEPPAESAPETRSPAAVAVRAVRALVPPGLLLFYVLASERLGFVPTAAIMAFVCAWALGARVRLALAVAVLAPIGVHLVFAKLLRVPLPDGLLPMPW
ncbi:MAG TPA: tripartite tricarboxylate transporter TctB family protein [Xanthobacteraceae bacterium]|nr:tripartite tricarboxylate transporter TctB family protein [Xanthobacteraceae bacterium]